MPTLNATDPLLLLSQYQYAAQSTAYFPPCPPIKNAPTYWSGNLLYCTMGLVGEMGEMSAATGDDLLLELGDCYWYVAMICNGAGQHLNHLIQQSRRLYPESSSNPEMILAAPIEAAKKLWRDGYTPARMTVYMNAVAIALGYVDAVRQANGMALEAVLQANLDKLAARHAKATPTA